jgi:hypothetical protein
MTNCIEDGRGGAQVVSLLTGAAREVAVRRKIVDARYLESSIPATHTPTFAVDDDVRCVPVNDLVVIGAGKTGMDACAWLLANGVDPGAISWVKPREPWVLDRASWQPREKVGSFIIAYAASVVAAAEATSVPDLFGRLEDCGQLRRLDTSLEPTMYRAAILSDQEVDQLRSIEHAVRAGHIRRLTTGRMLLDDDEVPMAADRLYVDCTADGLPRATPRPIFERDRITIQQLRETSPTFNAALIGYLEATRDDVEEQNRLSPTNVYPSSATDWIRTRHVGMIAQSRWNGTADVRDWIEASRLNVASGLGAHAGEPGVGPAIGSYLEHYEPAIENLAALRVQLGDDLRVLETSRPT